MIVINKNELKRRIEKMSEFTQEELSFIAQVLSQLTWKAGQSEGVVMSESVIKKCNEVIEQKQPDEKGE